MFSYKPIIKISFILLPLLILIFPSSSLADACKPGKTSSSQPYVYKDDVHPLTAAYKFPFLGYSPRQVSKRVRVNGKIKIIKTNPRNTILWKKIKRSNRVALYPAPNLPSCRIARLGTEDRSSYKALTYTNKLTPLNNEKTWELKDTFDRQIAILSYKRTSPIKRLPNRYGWYINNKWAGHNAKRIFEVQGKACKLTPVLKNNTWVFVNDPSYVMIAINPALGSQNGNTRPYKLDGLKFRAFIHENSLSSRLRKIANNYQFNCGSSSLSSFYELPIPNLGITSTAKPDQLINKYFGESSIQDNLLDGEKPTRNDYAYSTYNTKHPYDLSYLMINTTAVASGGMVRSLVRTGKDNIILLDEMKYCDPNYTLNKMVIKKNNKKISKSTYFKPYMWSSKNKPAVRWLFGRVIPDRSTLSSEASLALDNPLSQKVYGYYPITCDK